VLWSGRRYVVVLIDVTSCITSDSSNRTNPRCQM
jgi:hypothetical protein